MIANFCNGSCSCVIVYLPAPLINLSYNELVRQVQMKKNQFFPAFIQRFWPDLSQLNGMELISTLIDLIGFIYALPLALAGLIWLILVTDIGVFRESSWLLLALLLAILNKFGLI